MPYKYYLPNGDYYTVHDDVSKEQMDDLVRQKHPELFTPPESTMGGAFEHGLKSLASQVGTLVQAPFYGADEAARRAMRREREYTEEYGTGASLDKLGKTYEEQGVLPAAKELLHQSGLALAENAPQLGLMALSGGLGGLPGVAASTYLPRLAGGIESQAAEQQAQGKPIDVDVAKAAGYAVPQAALDVAAQAIPMGRTLAGKMFGPEVEKLLSMGATKDAEIAARNVLPSIARGVGKNLVTQELIQPAQVALARMENGQDLTSPDAFKDYGSAAYTAALLSPMGAVEGIHERSAAKDRIAAEQAKQAEVERRAAEEVVKTPSAGAAEPSVALPNPQDTALLPAPALEKGQLDLFGPGEAPQQMDMFGNPVEEPAPEATPIYNPGDEQRPVAAPNTAQLEMPFSGAQEGFGFGEQTAPTYDLAAEAKQRAVEAPISARNLGLESYAAENQGQLGFPFADAGGKAPEETAAPEAPKTPEQIAKDKAVEVILKEGKATIASVKRATGLSDTKVKALLDQLTTEGFLTKPDPTTTRKIRLPTKQLELGFDASTKEESKNAPVTQPDTGRNDRPIISEQPVERGTPASTGEPVSETRAAEPSAPEATTSGLDVNKPPATEPAGGERGSSDTLTPEDRSRILRMPLVDAHLAQLEANAPNVRQQIEEEKLARKQGARATTIKAPLEQAAAQARREAPTRSERAVEALKKGNIGEALYHLTNEAGGDTSGAMHPYPHEEIPALRYLANALFNTVHRGDFAEREKIIEAEIARRSHELQETQQRSITEKEKRDIRNRILNDHRLTKVDVLQDDGTLTAAGRIIYKAGKNGKPLIDKEGNLVRNFTPDSQRLVPVTGKARLNTYSGDVESLGGSKIAKGAFAGADVAVEKPRMNAEDKAVIERLKKEGKLAEYDPKQNKFYFTEAGLNDRTILHEMVHAATVKVLKQYENEGSRSSLSNTQRMGAQELHRIYDVAKKVLGKEHADALENIYEFASHAATDKAFQRALSEIPAGMLGTVTRRAPSSLWNMFTRALAKMFGMDRMDGKTAGNALLNAGQAIHDILSTPEKGTDVPPLAERAPPKSGTGVATEAASKIQEAHDAGDPKEELERFGDADLHLQSIDATRAEQARGAISRMGTMLKDAVQDAMSVYQKYQLYKDKLPSLKAVDEQINRAGAKLNNRQKEINDQVAGWLEATKKFPKQVMDNFNRIAVLSTLDQVEFFDDPVRKRKKEVDNPLVKQFEALPPELQEMYKTIRNKYEDLIQEYNKLLTDRMSPDDAKAFNLKYEQKRLNVYLPLFRRGEFWLSYTDKNNNPVRQSFTSEYARGVEEARLRKEGNKTVETYRNIEHMRENSSPPTGFLGDILKTLKDQNITDPDILNAVYETYLDYQPASSLRQRFRTRERRLGMEADILNAYSNVGGTMNRLVNSIEHAAGFDEAMAKLYEEAEANKSDSNIKAVVNSVRKQVEFARNPKTSKWAQMLGYGSYLWYLAGNASSAFINATHLPMVVYPMLGGKHGYGETSAAFKKAWSSINLKPDGEIPKGYEGLYNYANELGALGTHIGQEMFELRKISTNSYNGTFAKVKYGMDYMFRAADKLNREVALISAYELELKRTNGNVDAARQAAVDTVKTAYGSALAGAKAPIFQNNIARVALTFKSFAANRAFILGKMFHDAYPGTRKLRESEEFKKMSPEQQAAALANAKQVKRIARRQILGVYATAFAFSGVAGLPLVGFTEFLANQLMGDEDDPYDAEAEVRKASGDWAYKGPLNSLLNVEVSERTGWNDMIMKDDPKRLADVGMLSYIMEHSMGPMYNAVSQAGEAYDYFKQGKYERMFEATLPTAIRNGLKGVRYATEGARTTKGVPIGEVSGYNALVQGLGFAPADITEKRKINTAMDVEQQKLLSRYNAIVAQTVGAYNLGSPEAIADAQEAAAKWSAKHPEKPITPNVISAAMKREERKAQDAINGMSLNKKLAPELLEQQGLDMQGNKTY